MDASKKRRNEETGACISSPAPSEQQHLSTEDVQKILEPFTHAQLIGILKKAAVTHTDVLDAVRSIADRHHSQRKLFIRGLSCDTTSESLHSIFSPYGDLDEAVVITDQASGKSRGYGFITFKHFDGALLALKEPSKKIDGRMTVTQLAAAGRCGPSGTGAPGDVAMRRIYITGIPQEMSSECLLGHFSTYGEIEEGPFGFDKHAGKSKGFAFFAYKTEEGAKAALLHPRKNIDGHQIVCKYAGEGKKGNHRAAPNVGVGGIQASIGFPGNDALRPLTTIGSQYGELRGLSSHGGFPQVGGGVAMLPHHQHPFSIGGPALTPIGSRAPPSLSSGGAYVGGTGGAYGAGSQYGGSSSGESLQHRKRFSLQLFISILAECYHKTFWAFEACWIAGGEAIINEDQMYSPFFETSMDIVNKGVAWGRNICETFEAMCLEVDDIMNKHADRAMGSQDNMSLPTSDEVAGCKSFRKAGKSNLVNAIAHPSSALLSSSSVTCNESSECKGWDIDLNPGDALYAETVRITNVADPSMTTIRASDKLKLDGNYIVVDSHERCSASCKAANHRYCKEFETWKTRLARGEDKKLQAGDVEGGSNQQKGHDLWESEWVFV